MGTLSSILPSPDQHSTLVCYGWLSHPYILEVLSTDGLHLCWSSKASCAPPCHWDTTLQKWFPVLLSLCASDSPSVIPVHAQRWFSSIALCLQWSWAAVIHIVQMTASKICTMFPYHYDRRHFFQTSVMTKHRWSKHYGTIGAGQEKTKGTFVKTGNMSWRRVIIALGFHWPSYFIIQSSRLSPTFFKFLLHYSFL